MPIDNEFVKQANADRVSEMKRLLRPLPNFGQQSAARFVVPGERPKKVRAKPQHKEHEQQCVFFEMVNTHPRTQKLLIYAVPNAGGFKGGFQSNVMRAVRAKAEGVRKGPPDVNVDETVNPCEAIRKKYGYERDYLFPGLRIEFKKDDRKKNGEQKEKPTPEQQWWHGQLENRGYVVRVCYSAQEAWQVLIDYLDGKLT